MKLYFFPLLTLLTLSACSSGEYASSVLIPSSGVTALPPSTVPPSATVTSVPNLPQGDNAVHGSGFIRERTGRIVTCAGSAVQLIPATPMVTSILQKEFGNDFSMEQTGYRHRTKLKPREPNADTLEKMAGRRTAVCDRYGQYSFENIPDGDYYLTTYVMWEDGEFREKKLPRPDPRYYDDFFDNYPELAPQRPKPQPEYYDPPYAAEYRNIKKGGKLMRFVRIQGGQDREVHIGAPGK